MKSLTEIAWNIPESIYRADPALSYSTLAKFDRGGFQSLPTLFDKISSPSLTYGSIVDALITGTLEEFNNNFQIVYLPDISDSLKQIALLLHSRFARQYKTLKDIPNDALAQAGLECNYYANSKYETYRIKLIKENCNEYYNMLQLGNGKQLITREEFESAQKAVEALKTSEATKFYFNPPSPFETHLEKLYQLKFKGRDEQTGIDYRIMADLIVVDHKNKTIQPVDLKTSSHFEYEFHKSFVDWNYHEQARLYYRIIKQNCEKDEYFKNFEILDYKFIVVNKKTLQPCVWTFKKTKEVGLITIKNKYTNKSYNFRDPYDLGKELTYYLNNQDVKLPYDIKLDNDIIEYLENEL